MVEEVGQEHQVFLSNGIDIGDPPHLPKMPFGRNGLGSG